MEIELEKEIVEFKENLNPIDARLQAIKEKLRGIKTDEIQTPATYPILLNLYKEGLRPLFEEVIKMLSVFEEEFHSKSFGWHADNFSSNRFEQLDALWNDEENLKKIMKLTFFFNLFGFKKAGTENYNESLELKFERRDYSYEFSLVNHNPTPPSLYLSLLMNT